MNTVQVLALLAMVSMSVHAALAFLFWRERNEAIRAHHNLEVNFGLVQDDMRFWKGLATGDSSGLDTDDYLDDWQTPDDLTQWNYGPRDKWGSSNA